MVKFCEGCEASYEEGTLCDCGNFLVCNGDITAPGVFAFRYTAESFQEALLRFLQDGRWDGASTVDFVKMRIADASDYARWGCTYELDEAVWDDTGFITRPPSPYPNGVFNVYGPLVQGPKGIVIL